MRLCECLFRAKMEERCGGMKARFLIFVLGIGGVTCALTGVYLQPYGSPWLGIASSWHRERLIDIGIEEKRGNSFVRKGSRLEVKRGTIIGASCELFSAVEKTEQVRRDVNT